MPGSNMKQFYDFPHHHHLGFEFEFYCPYLYGGSGLVKIGMLPRTAIIFNRSEGHKKEHLTHSGIKHCNGSHQAGLGEGGVEVFKIRARS